MKWLSGKSNDCNTPSIFCRRGIDCVAGRLAPARHETPIVPVDPTRLSIHCSANQLRHRSLPHDIGRLIPASQNFPTGDLRRAIRSGCMEFQRHAEKCQLDEVLPPHDFLRHRAIPCWLTQSREGMKPRSLPSHSRFPQGCPVTFFCRLWAVTFRCQSNRQVECRLEPVVMC
jgi:hypothetical protein